MCTEDITFTDYKDHTLVVEKGMLVYIPAYSIHHDEEHYINPQTCDPDRTDSVLKMEDSNNTKKKAFFAIRRRTQIMLGNEIWHTSEQGSDY